MTGRWQLNFLFLQRMNLIWYDQKQEADSVHPCHIVYHRRLAPLMVKCTADRSEQSGAWEITKNHQTFPGPTDPQHLLRCRPGPIRDETLTLMPSCRQLP